MLRAMESGSMRKVTGWSILVTAALLGAHCSSQAEGSAPAAESGSASGAQPATAAGPRALARWAQGPTVVVVSLVVVASLVVVGSVLPGEVPPVLVVVTPPPPPPPPPVTAPRESSV
mgnify:CR=1 FL=1